MIKIKPSVLLDNLLLLCQAIATAIITALIFFLVVFVLTLPAHAEPVNENEFSQLETIQEKDDVKQGQLLFKTENNYSIAPLLKTNVDFMITGMIARVTVKQEFKNISNEWQEGIYVFPLPETAAVDQLRMIIGERIIEGQIKQRQQAKKIYQQAKQQGKKASLVEQERPNIFTNSVANIGPGEKVTIEIEYQQTIQYDSGKFSLRFPMVVAPRYIPGSHEIEGFTGSGWAMNTNQVEDASRITPPVNHPKQGDINPVTLSVELNPGFKLNQIYSPYHPVTIEEKDEKRYLINLAELSTPANKDFELVWQPDLNNKVSAAMFTETYEGNEYALLMMLPDINQNHESLKREIIFVIDTSGSMAGESIKQAKSALLLALSRLKTGDLFNVIQFNSYTESLFNKPKPFSSESIKTARKYINNLTADGGTEMLPAMKTALKRYGNQYDVRQVIFLTDGSIGNEDALFSLIENTIQDSRLFPIGIGSAPNSHFMNRAAKFGRGSFTYIGKTTEVQEKMAELFSKIESPVLTEIELDWHSDSSTKHEIESWPQSIPDVYSNEPLLIAVRAKKLPEILLATGKTAKEDWSMQLQLTGGNEQTAISKLWARRKIAALMNQRLGSDEKQAIETKITEVALTHHLVSKFTSLVAVDVTPSKIKQAALKTHAVPTNLPNGWEYKKVFGSLPQTATPALFQLLLGLLLIFLTYPIFRLTRNHV